MAIGIDQRELQQSGFHLRWDVDDEAAYSARASDDEPVHGRR